MSIVADTYNYVIGVDALGHGPVNLAADVPAHVSTR